MILYVKIIFNERGLFQMKKRLKILRKRKKLNLKKRKKLLKKNLIIKMRILK